MEKSRAAAPETCGVACSHVMEERQPDFGSEVIQVSCSKQLVNGEDCKPPGASNSSWHALTRPLEYPLSSPFLPQPPRTAQVYH